MKLEPMFPPQEQTIVNFNKPYIVHLRARQHKPFVHIAKGAVGFIHPPQTQAVRYAFVDNSSLELARHLLRHDRDLILVGTSDAMSGNGMFDIKTTKIGYIGYIGFNPNVMTQRTEIPIEAFTVMPLDLSDGIDKIVNHKPITHKPHKYGKGDWLSKRRK